MCIKWLAVIYINSALLIARPGVTSDVKNRDGRGFDDKVIMILRLQCETGKGPVQGSPTHALKNRA